ncbi:hypothetical protein SAMN04487851_10832 [Prevotella sp. tc2-28]|nr:hypothetical protein SAMN04487851_10832 [Prevotella sp. tc2-28]
MENINAVLINDGMPQGERLVKLNQIAIQQMPNCRNDASLLIYHFKSISRTTQPEVMDN